MTDQYLNKYAEFIIKKGINLYKGQNLLIRTAHQQYDFALLLADYAYQHGAGYVEISVVSNQLIKSRLANSSLKDLEYLPDYHTSQYNELIVDHWALISIHNNEETDLLKDSDTKKLQVLMKKKSSVSKKFGNYITQNHSQWCIVGVPGPKWAAQVYQTEESPQTTQKLWDQLKSILRLDTGDPIREWEKHLRSIRERKDKLNQFKLDHLIFDDGRTHLQIGLISNSQWVGGDSVTPEGIHFLPNVPTEEIFNTPDYRRTNGKVFITKPVKVMEKTVKGAWFEFKEGRVIQYGADEGLETLDQFLKIDEGAQYVGEIALVDNESPIQKSNLIFNCILYDENASCHLALGKGYGECLINNAQLITEEQKKEAGCNTSLVHVDFMIGSDKMNITGITKENEEITIMQNGILVL